MPKPGNPPRLGPRQVAALLRMLPTRNLQAFPTFEGEHRAADIWRGLRRKGVVEKDGPWARLSEVGLEAWHRLDAERRQEGRAP